MKHVFVVNPVSGKTDAGKMMVPKIKAAAAAAGIEPQFLLTERPKHATEMAREIGQSGETVRIYAVGGDGTLNEVLAGASPYKNIEVGSIPVGSGNDFVRNFGMAEDFLDLPGQLAGMPLDLDLMQVDDGISAAITSVGLDADVAYKIPKYRRIPLLGGSMAYNISIVENLLKPMGKKVAVTIDGERREGNYLIATVCNGQTYGGGFCAAPVASLTDGVLDVILVQKVSRLRIAGIIGRYKKGLHFENGEIISKFKNIIEYYKGTEVEIKPLDKDDFILNVDGECGPALRLYAKVMPLAGQFVLPKKLAEKQLGK
jgi:diacylglycerol kinase (ATP)